MRLNVTANSFVFKYINRENAPELFSQTLQGEIFKNAPELISKQLPFWNKKMEKCTQNFFL